MDNFKLTVEKIIDSIPAAHYFDTHTVIAILIQENHDEYLKNAVSFSSTELYHAHIGKIISSLSNVKVKEIGASFSKNVVDKFSKATCWQKK